MAKKTERTAGRLELGQPVAGPFPGGVDIVRLAMGGHHLPGQGHDLFHLRIAAAGIVMGEEQVVHLRLLGQGHHLIIGGMSPAPAFRDFLGQILGIVDQQVAAPDKIQQIPGCACLGRRPVRCR